MHCKGGGFDHKGSLLWRKNKKTQGFRTDLQKSVKCPNASVLNEDEA